MIMYSMSDLSRIERRSNGQRRDEISRRGKEKRRCAHAGKIAGAHDSERRVAEAVAELEEPPEPGEACSPRLIAGDADITQARQEDEPDVGDGKAAREIGAAQ